ncbi:HAMP domain-containing sensor histidine kinase [Mucilaginibacter celer]|uniref:histidine kinase n=1 Tax=Mucilaginibacter celer TaxID=2305508 RepID=A0A494W690_9SPHI|nr:ATP-binding protein [Mucilaginibacter celer]AYL98812.1 HAMP domain-containing protein [Mucilaginibacter celer]
MLVSAEDTYNNSKLNYLKYLLFGAFVIGTLVVWILSFSLSRSALKPLYNFRKKIQEITDSNLKIRLSGEKREDEINTLANSFNQMMDRIDNAYERQKEFTGNASHELRTPIARIVAQLENQLNRDSLDPATRTNLESISEDTFQLSEMVSSLVALADINSRENSRSLMRLRLDELVFSSVADLSKTCPDFKLKFEIEQQPGNEHAPEIAGDETLMKIALRNLMKNAYNYSDNHTVDCLIRRENGQLQLLICNKGEIPDVENTTTLFTTFYRGSNTAGVSGSGIGLSIVKRVMDFHNATVFFKVIPPDTNQVLIVFDIA